IIDASVFNTLKTDYPEKSIVFDGNDYSLTIKGSDITTLVPNTQQYDLSLTFSAPEEDKIWNLITDLSQENWDLEPVYVHFNHHGALPADMKFSISLGQKYQNSTLYWNYYNEERERIDYYGYVNSNAQGGFALPLTHMSTYVVTRKRIVGAENKVGILGGAVENLSTSYSTGKANPNTGKEQ
ncbi:MAG: hypothetical protein PHG02_08735, partial [Oscillospiraceae bacterium]|nr:hypothetical protein [Oscillospiraceae bacterium]